MNSSALFPPFAAFVLPRTVLNLNCYPDFLQKTFTGVQCVDESRTQPDTPPDHTRLLLWSLDPPPPPPPKKSMHNRRKYGSNILRVSGISACSTVAFSVPTLTERFGTWIPCSILVAIQRRAAIESKAIITLEHYSVIVRTPGPFTVEWLAKGQAGSCKKVCKWGTYDWISRVHITLARLVLCFFAYVTTAAGRLKKLMLDLVWRSCCDHCCNFRRDQLTKWPLPMGIKT